MLRVKLIKNIDELLDGIPRKFERLRRSLLLAAERAIISVTPEEIMKRKVKRRGRFLIVNGLKIDLSKYDEVVLLGAGKASHEMCRYLEGILDDKIKRGLIIVPHEIARSFKSERVTVRGGGHPIPDADGMKATMELIEIARSTTERSLVLVLISGGGSALMPYPADPVTLEDKIWITKMLLRSGATIDEINAVRKHLSMVKGGWLAYYLSKSRTISLILSDVVGDKLDVIASGPTSPDRSTYNDAIWILKKYGIWDSAPSNVKMRLERGACGELPETPKPGDSIFSKVDNIVIGSNVDACMEAYRFLRSYGYRAFILTHRMEGEARSIGSLLARILLDGKWPKGKVALVVGGETTVTVKGKGLGGRNQELALSAAIELDGKDCCCLSIGTDGLDGPTDAAGGIVDGGTMDFARKLGLNAKDYLDNNDSYNFLKHVKSLIFTGYTGTNVGDIVILAKH